jgi:putative FmdB family regulatory protein
MPTYEYACKSCDEHLEVVQSFKDKALTECPACGGPLRKVFGNIGITFKGSGFYRTDSRSDGRKGAPKSAEGKAGEGKAGEGKSGESKSGESKSGESSTASGSKGDGSTSTSGSSGSSGSSSGSNSEGSSKGSSAAVKAAS